jgi:hypothetical protein
MRQEFVFYYPLPNLVADFELQTFGRTVALQVTKKINEILKMKALVVIQTVLPLTDIFMITNSSPDSYRGLILLF